MTAQLCSESPALQAVAEECMAARDPPPLEMVERVLLSSDLMPLPPPLTPPPPRASPPPHRPRGAAAQGHRGGNPQAEGQGHLALAPWAVGPRGN